MKFDIGEEFDEKMPLGYTNKGGKCLDWLNRQIRANINLIVNGFETLVSLILHFIQSVGVVEGDNLKITSTTKVGKLERTFVLKEEGKELEIVSA